MTTLTQTRDKTVYTILVYIPACFMGPRRNEGRTSENLRECGLVMGGNLRGRVPANTATSEEEAERLGEYVCFVCVCASCTN